MIPEISQSSELTTYTFGGSEPTRICFLPPLVTLSEMNTEKQQSELKAKATNLSARTRQLRGKVEGLTTAATLDMIDKVDELETMVSALQRDAGEVNLNTGANAETVNKLHTVTNAKLISLEHEIDALSQGNPTTVSAAVDALVDIGHKD